jgi:hypothetical protein
VAQRGGRRPNAGRKLGSTNALALGEVKAIKSINLRVPENAKPEAKLLANWALGRIIDATAGQVHPAMGHVVLSGATKLREEVCGPVHQRIEHSGPDGSNLVVEIREFKDDE